VKKKSPTSAWRRFISSTRKTQRRPAAAYNLPGVADAAAAVAADAAAAEPAEAVAAAAAAALPADLAARLGASAASAEPAACLPTRSTNQYRDGRVRQSRPGHSMFAFPRHICFRRPHADHPRAGRRGDAGFPGFQSFQKMLARGLDVDAPAAMCFLRRRFGVICKMRVLTS
jgi:hypothetical protein